MSNKTILFFIVVSVIIFSLAVIYMAYAGAPSGSNGASTVSDLGYEPGELLVRFAPKADGTQRTLVERNAILAAINGGTVHHSYKLVPGLTLVKLPANVTVEKALVGFDKRYDILYAHPNYIGMGASTFPNDPRFDELWGMHNTGQTGGTSNADINAPEAWDIETDASDIIVAVIDSGVDYYHEDLVANMWINPGEDQEPFGVITEADWNENDDDENGFEDDICGWDFCTRGQLRDSDPMDELGHGTHVSGTLGAVGNNDEGVVGVCWKVKIVALRFIDPDNLGNVADAIDCIEYAVEMGAKVLNNSWGFWGGDPEGLRDAVEAAGENGQLFVVCAHNHGRDIDIQPVYPASYDLDNIISVMATDHDDVRSVWSEESSSNWGAVPVDLAAPGTNILSCVPPAVREVEYEAWNGTSMATPHVAGACALVWAVNPSLSHLEVKGIILSTVDVIPELEDDPELGRLCVTGGRLNAYEAVYAASHYARAFCVKDSSGERVAWFDNLGNLFLAGELHLNPNKPATGHDEFRVQDSLGEDVAIIDTTDGEMYIDGTLKLDSQGNWVAPTDGDDNFRIQDSGGNDVAYISKTGDLYLKGILFENSNP